MPAIIGRDSTGRVHAIDTNRDRNTLKSFCGRRLTPIFENNGRLPQLTCNACLGTVLLTERGGAWHVGPEGSG